MRAGRRNSAGSGPTVRHERQWTGAAAAGAHDHGGNCGYRRPGGRYGAAGGGTGRAFPGFGRAVPLGGGRPGKSVYARELSKFRRGIPDRKGKGVPGGRLEGPCLAGRIRLLLLDGGHGVPDACGPDAGMGLR
ncbi:hypothetical protein DXA32_10060 [Subdoligranulum sp. OF01-18]|nr:hypothetical protein DWW15_00190 [Subdoligranulum sp. AF14-43]RJW81481.1 hypothetical protein DXA32_10060 [Subdoligranulum sp. OF01-18]